MADCVLELSVDEMGLFTYNFIEISPELRCAETKNLNLNGATNVQFAISLTRGEFVGLRAQAGSEPPSRSGWATSSELESFGITPHFPNPWPPLSASTNGPLEFTLNIPNYETVYYGLIVKYAGTEYYGDPKIYNDPEPPPDPPLS